MEWAEPGPRLLLSPKHHWHRPTPRDSFLSTTEGLRTFNTASRPTKSEMLGLWSYM